MPANFKDQASSKNFMFLFWPISYKTTCYLVSAKVIMISCSFWLVNTTFNQLGLHDYNRTFVL
jgi:hypothetical protein